MVQAQSRMSGVFQSKPAMISLGVHVLLLLLFLVWGFNLPAPEPQLPELGMEVNLGTSLMGSGTDQPMDMEDPAADYANVRNSRSAASSMSDVEHGEDEEAPALSNPGQAGRQQRPNANPSQRNNNTVANQTDNSRNQQQQRPRYVYQGGNGQGGNSAAANANGSNEGIAGGEGDQGVPRGTPGASNYMGSPGTGTGGISYSLSGRTMVAFPPKEAQFRVGGRVVVRVTVARDGSVTNRTVKSSTNSELNPIALRKAQQVRFNASESAPEEQFGYITFVFKTRQ